MATGALQADASFPTDKSLEFGPVLTFVLKTLASLRLTVALFALSIFIIFVGTLAQVDMDMWEVIEKYFRSYIAMVDLQVFFPRTWFPNLVGKVPGVIPVPGGASIGIMMAINLLAAHLIRFKVQASGTELLMGLVTLAFGSLVTYWVIASGHNQSGLQGRPPFSWEALWMGIRATMFLSAIASIAALAFQSKASALQRLAWLGAAITCGGLGVWAATTMPSPSSLRILWQLIQGGLAGLVLLVGCYLVFKRRAGVVLLHAGIGLMMFSEFFVGQYAVEGKMSIFEGETVNFLRDIRAVELAVIDTSDEQEDKVTVIPGSRLAPEPGLFSLGKKDEAVVVSDDELPFDVHVEEFIANANVVFDEAGVARHLGMITESEMFAVQGRGGNVLDTMTQMKLIDEEQRDEIDTFFAKLKSENYADDGTGETAFAMPIRGATGTDGGEVDESAAYVEFRKKGTDESLGRYLVSQWATNREQFEKVEVDGKTWNVSLRYRRTYKPYAISLKDVRKDDYLGTNTPMNYSSDVLLSEGDQSVGDFKIWMNNPLRYAGETFYQSGYHSTRSGELTVLQVVTNTGWMMPYVGCMLVAIGMMVHFSGTLWRFLKGIAEKDVAEFQQAGLFSPAYVVPALIVVLFGGYVMSKFRAPKETKANMRIHDFGQLPVVYQGRVKPLDTFARNTLRIVSNKETFDDISQPEKDYFFYKKRKQLPAIRWLIDVMTESPEADDHPVYRIDNLDVLETLGLPRRKGFRYALNEFRDKLGFLDEQVKEARALPEEELSFYQRKLFEVERRLKATMLVQAAFGKIMPSFPTREQAEQDQEAAFRRLDMIQRLVKGRDMLASKLNQLQPPLAVPVDDGDNWQPFATAWNDLYASQLPPQFTGETITAPESTKLWDGMLTAYASGDTKAFNDSLDKYQEYLREETPENFNEKKVGFEYFFNYSQPFKYSLVLYIISFVLVAIAWLTASMDKLRTVNRCANWLLNLTFALHTFALVARIYISGRPPITNLYSSAVFIGWAVVAFGLVLEFLAGLSQRRKSSFSLMGIGNALAAVSGFATLQIAYALAADGDTFTVLQAVLDTQFWLATHVVCITLGYSTTFAAGLLGVIYIVAMAWRNPAMSKQLASMIYGTLCFAIFFSFVGTVLGGLWADDSWGRFWGWDPKENGALIIVLWNALILHARWGGMIRQKGLAILAVIGNITTAWSWFGVNELGVGLHSYGFTEGVLRNLGLFVISQAAIVLFAMAMMYLFQANKAASDT